MMKKNWKTYLVWILLTEAVGLISAWITKDAMGSFRDAAAMPALMPPAILFPIVWTILYALMGFGAARIWLHAGSDARTTGLLLYLVQLGFNFFWSIIFFNYMYFGFALLWLIVLWTLIVWMILAWRKLDILASNLQIPYILWVTFAAYLNYAIWLLN